ncbi:MAG: histidinol-phosphatase [Bacteroidales bacterium]|nr:histidinol-phosphatase [Bacteroidales bacterium]
MKKSILVLCALAVTVALPAQVRHEMQIPDIPGYKTLKGDMHIHTVFSDGTVWPTTRIDECVWEGIDVLCMTDHMEARLQRSLNKGYLDDRHVDRNTSWEIASEYAKGQGVLVIHGCEITSSKMPPGHFNAIFTQDNNLIEKAKADAGKDELKGAHNAFVEAKRQGAFLTWNHPHWSRQAPNETVIYDEHRQYLKEGLVNAVEIFNLSDGYTPEGHHWAVENGLTLVSGTDSHIPMFRSINFEAGELRPVTLIFAKEKSEGAVREALDAHRTVVFAEGKVYGDEALLKALLEACLKFEISQGEKEVILTIYNDSSIPFVLGKAAGSEQWVAKRHMYIQPFEHKKLKMKYNGKKLIPKDAVFALNYCIENFFVDAGVPFVYCFQ